LRFASDDVPKLVKRALFAHWKYERRRRTKRRQQAQINLEPNKRRRKTSAAGGKSKRRRPRNQSQGASEHKNSLANAARKLSRAFAKASLEALALQLEACQKMRACVFFPSPISATAAFAAASRCCGGGGAATVVVVAERAHKAENREEVLGVGGALGSWRNHFYILQKNPKPKQIFSRFGLSRHWAFLGEGSPKPQFKKPI
jgi:hypothetical protein